MRTFRETAYWTAVLAMGAGMLIGAPASADSTDNDGVNIGNDNNISVLPVQLCGNNIAVAGVVAPIASPQHVECVNAPIVDHPEKPDTEKPPTEKPPVEKPPVEKPPVEKPPVEKPPVEKPPVEKPPSEKPPTEKPPSEKPPTEKPPVEKPPSEKPPTDSDEVEDVAEELPMAPAPEVTEGHVAVTG